MRLLLSVGTLTEDIMVFGQPPCSAGRMKPRRAYYLGLLGPSTNGQSEVTATLHRPLWHPQPRTEGFYRHLPDEERLEGQGERFQRARPAAAPLRLATNRGGAEG